MAIASELFFVTLSQKIGRDDISGGTQREQDETWCGYRKTGCSHFGVRSEQADCGDTDANR